MSTFFAYRLAIIGRTNYELKGIVVDLSRLGSLGWRHSRAALNPDGSEEKIPGRTAPPLRQRENPAAGEPV